MTFRPILTLILLTLGCAVEEYHPVAEGGGGGPRIPTGGAQSGGPGRSFGGWSEGSPYGGAPSTGGADASGGPSGTPTGGATGSGGDDSGGGDTGGSGGSGGAGDPEPEPAPTPFPLPAALVENGSCWREPGDYPACRPIPDLDPEVIVWSCGEGHGGKEHPGQETVARLRVPPGSCMRLMGLFSVGLEGACTVDPTTGCGVNVPEHACVTITNTTGEDMFRYVTRRRDCAPGWGASWYAGECDPC